MGLNRVILHGRLVADPSIHHTPSGVAVSDFRIAVDRDYKDKETGERGADFINVVVWRSTAEFVAKHFAKGSPVLVEGRLQNKEYTDKEGVKHFTMEVQGEQVYFGGPKPQGQKNLDELEAKVQELNGEDDDGELPF